MNRRPPRLAERWLRSVVRDADAREGVLGDLREGYDRVARRFTVVGAHLWYWFSAVATLRWYVFERLREQRRGHGLGGRYDASRMGSVKTLWFDTRFAFRTLRRTPAFSVVAVLTIALGIGATTAIFTVLDGVVLKPLPYESADRVVRITHAAPTVMTSSVVVFDVLDGMSPAAICMMLRSTSSARRSTRRMWRSACCSMISLTLAFFSNLLPAS